MRALGVLRAFVLLGLACCADPASGPEGGGSGGGSEPAARASSPALPAPKTEADSASAAPTTPATSPTGPASADPFASTLTLYAIPAPSSTLNPSGLTWDSPGNLTRQVLFNEAGASLFDVTHTIGHAGVRVDCAATETRPAERFVGGMTNANDGDLRALILDEQVGLGVMFDDVPGKVESEASLQATLDDREKNGRMAFVRFGIASDVCHALLDYERAYEQLGIGQRYGLAARPLHKEGAGCSAFAMSFLELANLIEPRFRESWSFQVRVPMWTQPVVGSPEPLVGGRRNPGVKVPVSRIATLTRGWASPDEDGIDLFGWDPTRMFTWIDAVAARAQTDGSEKVEVRGKTRGLVLDRSGVAPSAALANRTFWAP